MADSLGAVASPVPRRWLTGLTVMAGALAPLLVVALALGTGEPVGTLTRDITAIVKVPPYYGLLSQLGIVAWTSTCAICLLAFLVLYRKGRQQVAGCMLSAGILTGLVLLDDAFLVHETVAPYFGVPERAVVLVLVACGLVHVVTWRRMLLTTQNGMLVWAILALALSIGVDLLDGQITQIVGEWEYLIEDGLKWLGAVFWLGFHLKFAVDALAAHR